MQKIALKMLLTGLIARRGSKRINAAQRRRNQESTTRLIATGTARRLYPTASQKVLPIALHIEYLAHAALHGHPGLVFHGFNDLRITQAIKLDADEALTVRAYAGKAMRQDKLFVVPVELRGKAKGGREMLKSRA